MATASADVECRKQWELEKRDSRKAEHREKTGRKMGAFPSEPDTICSE